MLLAIDVGNTSVHLGLFRGKTLVKEWRVATSRISGNQGIRKGVSGYSDIRDIIISSVVPKADIVLRKMFPAAKFVNYKNIGIKVKVKNPAEVGADRLVNALAAYKLYGGPAIIIDFGTATTFDVINAKGEYLGGAIAPGLELSRDILKERTAKLPKIEIKAPKNIIGKNTVEAMQSGLVFGYVAMVEGMVKRLRNANRVTRNASVVATGGLARLICQQTGIIDTIDDTLTLKGLRLLGS
ncbi:MAG: type III pantothenate kinase [Candidatus Margulisbacteria bacterium]|nr:type III pantothenate kinase [Candidatus Margulisiibacteriota bacterium]